jgi:hypothetical protein
VERLKVNFLISDEDVSIYVVERKYSSGENIGFFEHRFFRDTIDFTHIKRFFVEFVDNELIDAIFHEIIVLLFASFVKKDDPLLQIFNVFVRRDDALIRECLLICYTMSS